MNFTPNIPNLLLMIRPRAFRFNTETASSNFFQQNEPDKDVTEQAQSEFDLAVKTLKNAGILVKVFDDEIGDSPDVIFPNNWLAQIPGKNITLFPMQAEIRRKEVRQDIVDWVRTKTNASTVIDLTEKVNENQFLEGTGSIIFDHHTGKAFACESSRTSIALFENYCKQIGYQPYSFESVDLQGRPIYHTNVMMTIAKDFCLINWDSIPNQLERSFCKIALERAGKEMIPLTYPQMNAFAANALEVLDETGKSRFVMSETAYNSLTNEQLEKISDFSSIVRVAIPTIEAIGGGSIRCMLAGLFISSKRD